MLDVHHIHDIYRTFRLKGAARRFLYIVSKKTNTFKAPLDFSAVSIQPHFRSASINVERAQSFYDAYPDVKEALALTSRAILEGKIEGFGDSFIEGDWPPSWLTNPQSGKTKDSSNHWTAYKDSDPDDIKWLWQANRFQFAWTLGRHAIANKTTLPAAELLRCVDDWMKTNPSAQGPNWICGQETSLRALALLFSFSAFEKVGHTYTVPQLKLIYRFFKSSANRIQLTLGYALSQRNNHACSEIVALLMLSFALPEDPEAEGWRSKALSYLDEVLDDQFYSDGSYSQHSFNYQRLATLTLIMALEFYPEKLPPNTKLKLQKTVSASIEFLKTFINAQDGTLPNFGANDGAITLPLWSSDFLDYRPLIRYEESCHGLESAIQDGKHDELFSLFGHSAPKQKAPVPNKNNVNAMGTRTGYWICKSKSFDVFLRAPLLLKHRPSQEDFLAIHLRWNNEDIAIDPGTFSYNAPPPWDHGLAHGHQHNTCSPYHGSVLKKTGRFLWTHWPKSNTKSLFNSERLQRWEFSLQSKDNSRFLHKRIVEHGDNHVIVFDECYGSHSKTLLRWNLKALDWVQTRSENAIQLKRGNLTMDVRSHSTPQIKSHSGSQTSAKGWQSPWYGKKIPCLSVELISQHNTHSRFITIFSDRSKTNRFDYIANLWLQKGLLTSPPQSIE